MCYLFQTHLKSSVVGSNTATAAASHCTCEEPPIEPNQRGTLDRILMTESFYRTGNDGKTNSNRRIHGVCLTSPEVIAEKRAKRTELEKKTTAKEEKEIRKIEKDLIKKKLVVAKKKGVETIEQRPNRGALDEQSVNGTTNNTSTRGRGKGRGKNKPNNDPQQKNKIGKRHQNKEKENEPVYTEEQMYCGACQTRFGSTDDPFPDEQSIACNVCNLYWHVTCSASGGKQSPEGGFFCDSCGMPTSVQTRRSRRTRRN